VRGWFGERLSNEEERDLCGEDTGRLLESGSDGPAFQEVYRFHQEAAVWISGDEGPVVPTVNREGCAVQSVSY
jgi:hypothetical protein